MKRKRFQIIIMVALTLMIVLCIPGAFAKYTKTDTIKVAVRVKDEIPETYVKKYSELTNGVGSYKITRTGKYIIIAKGGNGGKGYRQSGGSVTARINGGTGGVVAGVKNFTKDEVIDVYLGSAGGNGANGHTNIKSDFYGGKTPSSESADKRSTFVGSAGVNAAGLGAGTIGNYVMHSESKDYANKLLYVVTGGSGAASVIKYNGSLLLVAGGGGAGASSDDGAVWSGVNARGGGAGGTFNVNSTYSNGSVINGSNGLGHSKNDSCGHNVAGNDSQISYGGGGTASAGGTAGETKSVTCINITFLNKKIPDGIAGKGKAYNDSANPGKGGTGKYLGGPGGGGYCGGGGGCGISADLAAGGGGGGSSYIGIGWNSSYASYYNSNQLGTSVDDGNGWVVIAYIGPAT